MPIPFSPLLLISACNSLITYRSRVDNLLALREVTQSLPFELPGLNAVDYADKLEEMLHYFETSQGRGILELHGLCADFESFKSEVTKPNTMDLALRRQEYYKVYDGAVLIEQSRQFAPTSLRTASDEEALAYYLVGSKRITRHPAVVNLLLATVDVLLEVAGPSIATWISHPGFTRILGSLLTEFAVKSDLEEESGRTIVGNLLAATMQAVSGNIVAAEANPGLKILFGTLGRVRESIKEDGDRLVESLLSADGLKNLLAALATETAGSVPQFIDDRLTSELLAGVLSEVGTSFRGLKNDREALLGILRVGINVTTSAGSAAITAKLGDGRPLLNAVLTGILQEMARKANENPTFAGLANGDVIPSLYQVTLGAIAANPPAFSGSGAIESFTSELVAGLAKTFSEQSLITLISKKSLHLLAQDSLFILAENPEVLVSDNRFGINLLGSLFRASSTAIGDGLTSGDLLEMARTTINAAASNARLLSLDAQWLAVIESAGEAIASIDLSTLIDRQQRKSLILQVVRTILVKPDVWGSFHDQALARALIEVVLAGLNTAGPLLSGPRFVDATARLLRVCGTNAQLFLDQTVPLASLKTLLTTAIDHALASPGQSIEHSTLPIYLEGVVATFLKTFADIHVDAETWVMTMTPLILQDLTTTLLADGNQEG